MQLLAIVSGALMFSVLQIAVIGYLFFGPLPDTTAPSLLELIQSPNILFLVGGMVFSLGMSFIVPNLLLKSNLVHLPQKTSFSLEKDIVPRYFPSHFFRFALLEAIAIIGLIITLTTHNTSIVVGSAAFSILMMGLFFPTKETVTKQINDASSQKIRLG